MISFLIPIYNFDVKSLVTKIHQQALILNIEFEIILVDDASSFYLEDNSKLSEYKFVKYIRLDENYGRSKVRNYLATLAKFQNLIFLDCDSGIISNTFVQKYIEVIHHSIVYGGRNYHQEKPSIEFLFHWIYGNKREVKPLNERIKEPNKGFQTNNFLIKKELFCQIKFNEKLHGYGHEDTLFGYELKKRNIKIHHIDNPVIHLGLETTDEFLKKTRNGISNLLRLIELFPNEKELFEDIKLLNYFFKIKKFYFCGLLKIGFTLFNKLILLNLKGEKPNLKLFDFYKISYMCIRNK